MAGLFAVQQLSTLPSLTVLWCLPFVILLLKRYRFLEIPACVLLGCSWMLLSGHVMLRHDLPMEMEQLDLRVQGRIMTMPEDYGRFKRFRFQVTHLLSHQPDKQVSLKPFRLETRLNWYDTDVELIPGQTWQFSVRLKRPHGFLNPGGFDYEAWLIREGIRALGYVRNAPEPLLIRSASGMYVERLRAYLASQIRQSLPEDYQGLVLALSLGDRSRLDATQQQLFQMTGTSHLIAISGLHLGLVAGMVFWLVRNGWRRAIFLTSWVPAPVAALLLAFCASAVYALLAGFSLPTQRALIMIAVVLISVAMSRPVAIHQSLSIAAVLVLLVDPLSLQSNSFWLSFGAVLAILYLLNGRAQPAGRLQRWLHMQFSLCLILGPLLIICFNQLPVYSVIANMVAIPVVGLVMVPLILMALVTLLLLPAISTWIYLLVMQLADWIWWFLQSLQALPMHVIILPQSTTLAWLCALIGILILFMPRGLPARWLGLVWLLPLVFPHIDKPEHAEFRMTLLDVGQGLAALVETHQHALLYDTGARFSERFNVGEAVIVPYLHRQGLKWLDVMVVSHGDNDHIGGAAAVLKSITTGLVLSSVPDEIRHENVSYCQAGQGWRWDGVRFDVLHPGFNSDLRGNNASCVLKVSGSFGSVLLSGDIERRAELELLRQQHDKLDSNVLIVPHHGSRSSSTPAFIDAVAPGLAIVAAGYRNRFGLPKQDIIRRYRQRDIVTRLSYQSGAIQVRFARDGITVNEYRDAHRRFWHNNARLIE